MENKRFPSICGLCAKLYMLWSEKEHSPSERNIVTGDLHDNFNTIASLDQIDKMLTSRYSNDFLKPGAPFVARHQNLFQILSPSKEIIKQLVWWGDEVIVEKISVFHWIELCYKRIFMNLRAWPKWWALHCELSESCNHSCCSFSETCDSYNIRSPCGASPRSS